MLVRVYGIDGETLGTMETVSGVTVRDIMRRMRLGELFLDGTELRPGSRVIPAAVAATPEPVPGVALASPERPRKGLPSVPG